MANNELALLDQVLAQRQSERSVPMRDDDAFELFACEQALHSMDLSAEEIADGVVGGGDDGGIDGVYVLLGGVPLSEDSPVLQDDFAPNKAPVGARLDIWFVQAKRETSFTETAIDKIASSTRRLLSLNEDEADLRRLYSDSLVERTGYFRNALRALATRHPKVEIKFVYATRGSVDAIDSKVEIKARDLERQFSDVMPGASGESRFMGAAELWRTSNTVATYTSQLTFQESATSGNSHIALVQLNDYFAFLTDDGGNLRRHIFDWNVRDYQGDVEVNREIIRSLQSDASPEFWWLNNGITVVCSQASAISKTYSLDDVQVVNGLQTSHAIFNVLRGADDGHPARGRSVLVRILVTGDDQATRDLVIRATNRQTSVPQASLRATDEIQRDIEAYFLHNDWYYDRRKNYYRNNGKSVERIVSIPFLAQAAMAMGFSRPDNSRARPSSLLKRDEEYRQIFAKATPLEVYLWLAESQKGVDSYLASEEASATAHERTNLRFHLAMLAAASLVGGRVFSPRQLRSIAEARTPIIDADLPTHLQALRQHIAEYMEQRGDALDKTAKSNDFVEYLLSAVFPTGSM